MSRVQVPSPAFARKPKADGLGLSRFWRAKRSRPVAAPAAQRLRRCAWDLDPAAARRDFKSGQHDEDLGLDDGGGIADPISARRPEVQQQQGNVSVVNNAVAIEVRGAVGAVAEVEKQQGDIGSIDDAV